MSIIGFYVEDYYSNPLTQNSDVAAFIEELTRLALLAVAVAQDTIKYPDRAEMYMWN